MNKKHDLERWVEKRIQHLNDRKRRAAGDRSEEIAVECRIAECHHFLSAMSDILIEPEEGLHEMIRRSIIGLAKISILKGNDEHKMMFDMAVMGLDLNDKRVLTYAQEIYDEMYADHKNGVEI